MIYIKSTLQNILLQYYKFKTEGNILVPFINNRPHEKINKVNDINIFSIGNKGIFF